MSDLVLTVRRDPAVIDALAPVYESLRTHHESLADGSRVQGVEVSWALRRAEYAQWLADPAAFVVLAERDGKAVGYAFVTVADGPDDTWITGRRIAEIESLAVLPNDRGAGIGAALLDAVDTELEAAGVHDLQLAVVVGNDDALRFYARRGLVPRLIVLSNYGPRAAEANPHELA